MFCSQCGQENGDDFAFCTRCSSPLRSGAAAPAPVAPPAYTPPPAAGPAVAGAPSPFGTAGPFAARVDWRSGQVLNGAPVEVWVVVGLIGYAAAYLVINGLDVANTALDALNYSALLGLSLIILGLAAVLLGAVLGGLAWLVYRGEPEAPVLALVAAGLLLWQLFYAATRVSESIDVWSGLLIVAALVWAAALVLLPGVHDWFAAKAAARTDPYPLDVGISRRLAYLAAALLGFNGLAGLLLAISVSGEEFGPGGSYLVRSYLTSILLLAGAAVFYRGAVLLGTPATGWQGRLLVTGAAAAAVVALLITVRSSSEGGFLLGLVAATAVGLWARPVVREYFEAHRSS